MTKIFVISDNDLTTVQNISESDGCHQKLKENVNATRENMTKLRYARSNHQNSKQDKNITRSNKANRINVMDSREILERTTSESISGDPNSAIESNRENKKTDEQLLKDEKNFHRVKEPKREEGFRSILLNELVDFSWAECLLYPISIVLIGFISTLPLSLIPAHDLV